MSDKRGKAEERRAAVLGADRRCPDTMTTPNREMSRGFASRVLPNAVTGCWEWIGARDQRGYGNVRVGRSVRKAHRVLYELTRGPIPADFECDHLCRVPWCVNPAHLEVVPHLVNVRRGAACWVPGARQRAKRRCPAGHAYTKANTYIQPSTRGRVCRTCARERKRAASGQPVAAHEPAPLM